MGNTIIVTRHPGLVEWLKTRKGIEGDTISHADEEAVRGKRVYGVLPFRLAALADKFTEVTLDIPPELRGKEISVDDIDKLNPRLTSWKITEIPEEDDGVDVSDIADNVSPIGK